MLQVPEVINIYTSEEVDRSLYVSSTLPIVCGCCQYWTQNTNGNCTISDIRVINNALNVHTNQREKHTCEYSLNKETSWLEIPLTVERRPGSMDEVQTFKIEFEPLQKKFQYRNDPYIWENYQISPVLASILSICLHLFEAKLPQIGLVNIHKKYIVHDRSGYRWICMTTTAGVIVISSLIRGWIDLTAGK